MTHILNADGKIKGVPAVGVYVIDATGKVKSTGAAGAPTDATYIVVSLDGTLTADRALTAGTSITLTDGGANNNITIALGDHDHTGDAGDGGQIDHGLALTGLGDDDHTQYLLADGTRALGGAWDMGSQALTNANIDTGDIANAVTQAEWDAAHTHISNDGTDHGYIDQDLQVAASPTFAGVTLPTVTFDGATGANAITVPDNLADALHVSDAGGIEYLKIISTDTQPIVRFNDGGADIDYEVEAVGVADALQIRGADGQITLGVLTAGFVKSSAAGVLSVAAEVALTELGSYLEGRMIIGGAASDWTVLAPPGAAGHALISNAASFVWDQTPTWTGLHTFEAGLTVTESQSIDVLSGAVTVGGWEGAVDPGVGVTGEIYAKGEDAGEPNAIVTLAAYKHDGTLSCTIELYSETKTAIVNDILQVTDYVVALGGVHVGGVADPGVDNLIVDGLVGVGTAAPDTLLHLETATGATALRLTCNDTQAGTQFEDSDTGNIRAHISYDEAARLLKFHVGSNLGTALTGYRVVIDSAGHTGFGTNAPGARVEVNGDAADDPLVILDALDDADSAFIDFKGATAANCTASVSTGAVGLFNTGTHIKVKLNGAVRYLRTYICS